MPQYTAYGEITISIRRKFPVRAESIHAATEIADTTLRLYWEHLSQAGNQLVFEPAEYRDASSRVLLHSDVLLDAVETSAIRKVA